jgi:hypothetical protein
MNIDYVIVSSDNNPTYLDFWDITKKMWCDLVGIKPVLLKISDKDNYTDNGDNIVIEVKAIENINTGLQSQIIRLFCSKYFENKNILISDIDMIPLNKSYFINSVSKYDDDSTIIYSSDAYGGHRYPMCYVLSNSETFNKIFELDNHPNFESFANYLIENENNGWNTDELYLTKKINEYNKNIIKLNRGWNNGRANNRIDRVFWNYNINELKNKIYIDSHLLRPYSRYKNEINDLIKLINY